MYQLVYTLIHFQLPNSGSTRTKRLTLSTDKWAGPQWEEHAFRSMRLAAESARQGDAVRGHIAVSHVGRGGGGVYVGAT